MRDNGFKLILIRHGNTFNPGDRVVHIGKKTDLPLTQQGQEQALNLAKYFKAQHILPKLIYCGTLQRQSLTAEILAKYLGQVPIQANQLPLEEIDYGPWEGLTETEIKTKWPNEFEQWNHAAIWPTKIFQKSWDAHYQLLKCWIEKLIQCHQPKETVFAVSSNGIIRSCLALTHQLWPQIQVAQNFQQFKVKTGAFCELNITQYNIDINQWNVSP
jgi:probable phosphoglycerate mutase